MTLPAVRLQIQSLLRKTASNEAFLLLMDGSECLPLTAESELPVLHTALHMPEEIRLQSWS